MVGKINISIPQPCHGNWQQMTPAEKGRFCGSCQKNVIDFTNASDAEIIKSLNQNNHICGRFSPSQLNRNLVQRKEKDSIWLATTSVLLSFLSLNSQEVTAQEKFNTEQTDKKSISQSSKTFEEKVQRTINGTVTEGNFPLPGVSVVVMGTAVGTQTDIDGKFSIMATNDDVLVFSFIGMKDLEKKISSNHKYLNIKMEPHVVFLGEVVVVKKTFVGRTFKRIGNWFR